MDVFDLYATISLNTDDYKKGLSDASDNTETFSDKIQKGFAKVSKIAATALAAATTAVVAFAKSSIETGEEFDSSMSQVAATMGTTVGQIQELRDFALEMGASTAFSATEAAEALNYMALAGYSAEESMEALPNVLNLAAAGGMDLATASDMVTDAQSALGLTMEESTELVDKMAKASSKSNTSVSQLGEAILTIGGTAQNLAGGTTELATALGILADNGIKGSEGGTHLRNVILSLTSPTDAAATALDVLGVEVFDAEGNMRSLEDIITDLNAGMDDMTQAEKTNIISTIFNKTDLSSVNALLNTTTDRWAELTEAIDDSTGAAEAMANTQLDNLEGDITLFKSALEGAQITLSDQLTPTLREFVEFGTDAVGDLSNAFQEGGLEGFFSEFGNVLSEALEKIIDVLPEAISAGAQLLASLASGLVGAAPVLFDAAEEIVGFAFDGIMEGLPKLAKAAASMMESFGEYLGENLPTLLATGLNMVMELSGSLRENAGLLVDGALGLITGLAEGLIDSLPVMIETIPTIITNIAGMINDNAPKLITTGLELIGKLLDGIVQAIPVLIENIPQVIEAIVSVFTAFNWLNLGTNIIEGIKAGIDGMVSALSSAIVAVGSALINAFKELFGINSPSTVMAEFGTYIIQGLINGITSLASSVTEAISNIATIISTVMGTISTTISTVWENITTTVTTILTAISAFISTTWDTISTTITTILTNISDTISNIWTAIWNFLSPMLSTIQNTVSNVMTAMQTVITTVLNAVYNLFSSIWNAIRNILSSILSSISSTISSIFNSILTRISSTLTSARNVVSTAFGNIASNISNSMSNALNAVTNILNNIRNIFSNIIGSAASWGSDMVQGFANGVIGTMQSALNAVSSLASSIRSIVGFSVPETGPLSDADTYMPDFMNLLASGIESNSDEVIDEANNLADSVSSALNGDYTASVTGVGDVESGAIGGQAEVIGAYFTQLFSILQEYFPQFANTKLYLDGNTLVGGTAARMDVALGKIAVGKERGH